MQADQSEEKSTRADRKKVLVVYGNNLIKREMFAFLRALRLDPIEWETAVDSGAPFVGEILESAFDMAQAVLVLLTADEEVRRRNTFQASDDLDELDSGENWASQSRPNVLFEAGMAFGRYPNRTILVEMERVRPFSDIAGRHLIRFRDRPGDRLKLVQRLKKAGCEVDDSGNDWISVGNFNI